MRMIIDINDDPFERLILSIRLMCLCVLSFISVCVPYCFNDYVRLNIRRLDYTYNASQEVYRGVRSEESSACSVVEGVTDSYEGSGSSQEDESDHESDAEESDSEDETDHFGSSRSA